MFGELLEKTNQIGYRTRLDETLSAAAYNRIKAQVGSPEIRPQAFDVTLEAWLKRISLWGTIGIEHFDPDLRRKKKISQSKFVRLATDDQLVKMLGQWDIDVKDVNKVEFFREYVGIDGKRKKESFLIVVDLNQEIKKALK